MPTPSAMRAWSALGRAYHRAGLSAPPVLQSWEIARLAQQDPADDETDPGALVEQLASSIAALHDSCDGQLAVVHQLLGESLAALPDEACEALVHALARREDGHGQQLALYWLLDPRPALARAAAGALRDAADNARLAAGVAARLAWMRSLLPPGETLQAVDRALASHRRRQRAWPAASAAGRIDQARASVPDGAGAQYLALGAPAEHGYTWSMVLIKAGLGIRDAYVLSALDTDAEQALWGSLADAADVFSVSHVTATALLGAALGETHQRGERPPPGLIDVLEIAGLTDLRPRAYDARDWLRELDPGERLANLSPQKRGRLINRGPEHAATLAVCASWFEDQSEVTELLERTPSHDKRVQALREYLESRRAWWAELCLRSAHVLQHAEPAEASESLAVTGLALLDGRELKRIPLMTTIVETTIAAHEQSGRLAAPGIDGGGPWPPAADVDPEESLAAIEVLVDPGRARLQPLFDRAQPPPEQSIGGYFGLHGYLFALATHPDVVPPSRWLGPLLEQSERRRPGFGGRGSGQQRARRPVRALQPDQRAGHGHATGAAGGCAPRSRPVDNLGPAAPLGQWATGFARARQHFGHVVDRPMQGLDDDGEIAEGLRVAIELIEFLDVDPDTIDTGDSSNESFDSVAELACNALGENLKLLCVARTALRRDAPGALTAARDEADAESGPWDPQTILHHLDDPQASYQWEAMDQAVAQASAITPLLLERLEAVAADPQGWAERSAAGLLYTIVLLGHFRVTAAHEPLLRLAALPEEVQDRLLGDAITELLPVLLWQTSGGETAGLERVAEQRAAYGFGRGAAIEALVFGVLFGELDRDGVLAYLVALLQDETFAPADDPAWFCLLNALLDLHPGNTRASCARDCRGHPRWRSASRLRISTGY
ncbi:MAG: DUF1186 domain-containing protein [Halofilum sp. (in: g-proteobacteria)]|nr:DUF1186 domain-containing protein [Halofilum sp. (in: g-proteobacteria)]